MGSKNKTPYIGLSQYAPDSKPTWQGDVNRDNKRIDNELARLNARVESLTILVKQLITKAPADGVLDEIRNNYDGTITID